MTNASMEKFPDLVEPTVTELREFSFELAEMAANRAKAGVARATVAASREDFEVGHNTAARVKCDRYGLPLVPQPSRFSDDPLVSDIFFSGCG